MPRSGPLQRSSASPIAATGATDGTASPATQPTSGRRSPRKLSRCGASVARRRSRSWRPRWPNPRSVAAGRAMLEVELDLGDAKAGACGVDRHPRLDTEAGRDREELRARCAREDALTRQRLADTEPTAPGDERAGDRLGDPEAAARAVREDGDGEIGVDHDERCQVAAKVGVAEEEWPTGALALGERQRLALSPPWQPDDARPGLRRAWQPSRRASRRRRRRPRLAGNAARSAATVSPIRASSSRAATSTVSPSVTPRPAAAAGVPVPGGRRPRRSCRRRSSPSRAPASR